jgi:hypothetical protein
MQAFHSHDRGIQKDHYEVFIWLLITTHQVFIFCYSLFCVLQKRSSFCFLWDMYTKSLLQFLLCPVKLLSITVISTTCISAHYFTFTHVTVFLLLSVPQPTKELNVTVLSVSYVLSSTTVPSVPMTEFSAFHALQKSSL